MYRVRNKICLNYKEYAIGIQVLFDKIINMAMSQRHLATLKFIGILLKVSVF